MHLRGSSISRLAVVALIGTSVLRLAPPSAAQPSSLPAFSGYASGTVLHAGLLQTALAGPRLLNVDEAFSGATVAAQGSSTVPAEGPGAKAGQIVNEMSREIQGILPNSSSTKTAGDNAFARGAGLEVGIGESLPAAAPQLPINTVKVSADPTTSDLKEIGPLNLNPLLYASLLRGSGQAKWNGSTCVVGAPLSQGTGYAADVQLLNTSSTPFPNGAPLLATSATSPERAVAQSFSQTALVPQTDASGNVIGSSFGVGSETRQTIAPVTFFKNTANELTIEVLGEWVLQAVAGGVPGSAWVHYGPQNASPQTPILRIVQPNKNPPVTKILDFQDVFGPGKLPVPLIDIPGLARITIGEIPRVIGSDGSSSPAAAAIAADGTSVGAAVDVVRVQLLETRNPLGQLVSGLADVRLGHMESQASVPAGGVNCPLPITKTVNPTTVTQGQKFSYTITVSNPYDCTLNPVSVTDTITPGAVKYSVLDVSPAAGAVNGNIVKWDNVGPLAPGGKATMTIDLQIAGDSPPGLLSDVAGATGTCTSGGSATGIAHVVTQLFGTTTAVQGPTVQGGNAATAGGQSAVLANQITATSQLPRTGGVPGWLLSLSAALLLLGGAGLRLVRRLHASGS